MPASDGGRFDVLDPATGQVLTTVADGTRGRRARRGRRRGRGGRRLGRDRRRASASEILRRAFELMTEQADDLAKLVTLENGKALADASGEVAYAAEFFRWYAEEAVRAHRRGDDGAVRGEQDPRAAAAGRHLRAGDAVELPRRDGHPQDRPGAGRRVHGRPQAGQRHPADGAGDGPDPRRGRRARRAWSTCCRPGGPAPVVSAMLHDPRVRKLSFTGQHRGRAGAAQGGGRPGHQLLDGARRQRPVPRLRRRRPRRRGRRRDGRQDAQRRRGVHRGQPVLRRALGRRGVRPPAGRADDGAADGPRRSTTAPRSGPLVNDRRRRQGRRAGAGRRRRGRRGRRRRPPSRGPRTRGFYYEPTVLLGVAAGLADPRARRSSARWRRSSPSTTRTRRSGWPTTPSTAWSPTSTPATSPAACGSARRSSPAWSGSTAAWSATRPRRSAAPSRAASAARAATRACSTTWRASTSPSQW